MKYQFYTADVFTDKLFNGAQIAVIPEADGLSDQQMQSIAGEFMTTEVVFITEPSDNSAGANSRKIRIFSAAGELGFGSHTTVAAAHVLASIGNIKLEGEHTPVKFESKSGLIDVSVTQKDGLPVLTQLTRAINPKVDSYVPSDSELADILTLPEDCLDTKKYQPLLVSCDTPYLIVPLKSYKAVRDAKFSFRAWSSSVAPAMLAQEILLFCSETEGNHAGFHARLVGPSIAPLEDPAIGAAVPAFVGYLCAQSGTQKGTHSFVAERGTSTARVSTLNIEMDNKQSGEIQIRVGGPAVMVSEGMIEVPAA